MDVGISIDAAGNIEPAAIGALSWRLQPQRSAAIPTVTMDDPHPSPAVAPIQHKLLVWWNNRRVITECSALGTAFVLIGEVFAGAIRWFRFQRFLPSYQRRQMKLAMETQLPFAQISADS